MTGIQPEGQPKPNAIQIYENLKSHKAKVSWQPSSSEFLSVSRGWFGPREVTFQSGETLTFDKLIELIGKDQTLTNSEKTHAFKLIKNLDKKTISWVKFYASDKTKAIAKRRAQAIEEIERKSFSKKMPLDEQIRDLEAIVAFKKFDIKKLDDQVDKYTRSEQQFYTNHPKKHKRAVYQSKVEKITSRLEKLKKEVGDTSKKLNEMKTEQFKKISPPSADQGLTKSDT